MSYCGFIFVCPQTDVSSATVQPTVVKSCMMVRTFFSPSGAIPPKGPHNRKFWASKCHFISYHIISIFIKRHRQSYRGAETANISKTVSRSVTWDGNCLKVYGMGQSSHNDTPQLVLRPPVNPLPPRRCRQIASTWSQS